MGGRYSDFFLNGLPGVQKMGQMSKNRVETC
jgi:hypothetical protein